MNWNFVHILKDDGFKNSFKNIGIFIITFIVIGIIIGMTVQGISTPVAKYVSKDSLSAQVMEATESSIELNSVMICLTNIFIAGVVILLPNIIANISYIPKWLNPGWVVYFVLGFQIFVVSSYIGYASAILSVSKMLAALLPHGVIEIPAVLIAGAIGIAMFSGSFKFSKTDVVKFFGMIIVPLLIIAALVENFVTPVIMSMVV